MSPALITITVTTISLIGTLGGIWWRSQHEAKEKEKERHHAREIDALKDKRQAGHTIIKSFTIRLEYYSFMERYYEEVLETKDIPRLLQMSVDIHDNHTAGIIKRNEELIQPTFQSFYTYFAQDDDNPEVNNALSEMKTTTKYTKELTDRFTAFVLLLGGLHDELQIAAHDTAKRHKQAVAEIEATRHELYQVTYELLEITRQGKTDTINGIAHIREQIQ